MTCSPLTLDCNLLHVLAHLNVLHVWALSKYCHLVWSLQTLEVLLLWTGLCLRWCGSIWFSACGLVALVVMGRLWRVHQLWHFLYPVGTISMLYFDSFSSSLWSLGLAVAMVFFHMLINGLCSDCTVMVNPYVYWFSLSSAKTTPSSSLSLLE